MSGTDYYGVAATKTAHVAILGAPRAVVIQPRRRIIGVGLSELWAYRELLYFLAWRDVKVRYKQTVLGVMWTVIQPVMTMLVFTVIFGRLAKMPSDGVPYPLFSFAALLPWQLFAHSVTVSSQSVVAAGALVKKVYFPRLIIPISSVLAGLVDFMVASLVLLGLFAYYGMPVTARVLAVPVFVVIAVISALAVGLWLSALNVKYRDVRHAVPFLVQLWLFASPVFYPSSMIPARWQWLYGLNPMAGVVEGFRWSLLGTAPPVATVYVSLMLTAVLLVGGLYYFRSTERTFADLT